MSVGSLVVLVALNELQLEIGQMYERSLNFNKDVPVGTQDIQDNCSAINPDRFISGIKRLVSSSEGLQNALAIGNQYSAPCFCASCEF